MAISNGNEMVMPVAPMGNFGGMGGFGNSFGGDWGWIILLLLIAGGGWGGFGGFGGGAGLAADGAMLYPWMNQANLTQDGFQNQMLNDNVTSIRDGINSISSQLCSCCCDMRDTVNSGFYNAEVAAANRQMANMNQAFAAQSAMTQGFNGVQAATADLKYTVATENCADRQTINEGIRDIIASQTANTQAILDKLCDQELQAERRENQNLRDQLNMATLRESQIAQNAFIQQGFANEVDQLYNRLNSCPVPSTPVYGRTPIFTCNQNQGCGCGCGNY